MANEITDEQILACLDGREPVRTHHGAAVYEYRLFPLIAFARRVLALSSPPSVGEPPQSANFADLGIPDAPESWDEDYRETWRQLQVAEHNKRQWRAYALKSRAALATDSAKPAGEPICPRCGGSGDQAYLVGGGPDAHDEISPCSKCAGTGVISAENEAEHFIQATIDSAPEPLRRLGEYLGRVLNEDQWATAERMLLSLAAAPDSQVDADGEAFRTAASLGLTLRFYGGCAQSGMPGSPCAYEVVNAADRATGMREAVRRAAQVIARGGEAQRVGQGDKA